MDKKTTTVEIIDPSELAYSCVSSSFDYAQIEKSHDIKKLFDRKKNIFDHIFYEIEMFLYTFSDSNIKNLNVYLKNAVMESNRIHLRNLFDFFRKEKRYDDDIIISDLISNAGTLRKIENVEDKFKNLVKECKEVIDKLTAHLTLKRINKSKDFMEKCNPKEYFDSIIENLRIFFDALEKNEMKEEYKKDFENADIQKRFNALKNYMSKYEQNKKPL